MTVIDITEKDFVFWQYVCVQYVSGISTTSLFRVVATTLIRRLLYNISRDIGSYSGKMVKFYQTDSLHIETLVRNLEKTGNK